MAEEVFPGIAIAKERHPWRGQRRRNRRSGRRKGERRELNHPKEGPGRAGHHGLKRRFKNTRTFLIQGEVPLNKNGGKPHRGRHIGTGPGGHQNPREREEGEEIIRAV